MRRFRLPAVLLVLSLLFVTAETFHYTKTTGFCLTCHEIRAAEATWRNGPHYNNSSGVVAQCADCHIPPGAAEMVVDKAGRLSELYAHLTEDNSPQLWAARQDERGKRARAHLQNDACRKCHDVSAIQPASDTGRTAHALMDLQTTQCVQCHQNVGHRPLPEGGARS